MGLDDGAQARPFIFSPAGAHFSIVGTLTAEGQRCHWQMTARTNPMSPGRRELVNGAAPPYSHVCPAGAFFSGTPYALTTAEPTRSSSTA
jgi:hypothetical protein